MCTLTFWTVEGRDNCQCVELLCLGLLVVSIEFDRDDELFATAGVSRRIKVFEFATVFPSLLVGPWLLYLPHCDLPKALCMGSSEEN